MDKVEALAKSLAESPQLVTIKLDDGSTFNLQEPLLRAASDYFRTALNGKFQEGNSMVLRLPGCSAENFKNILYWIVNRDIETPDWNFDNASETQVMLAKLWAAADMYLLPKLQNTIIEGLRTVLTSSRTSLDAVSHAFELTSEDSMLRQMFIYEVIHDRFGHLDYTMSQEQRKIYMEHIGRIPGCKEAILRVYRGEILKAGVWDLAMCKVYPQFEVTLLSYELFLGDSGRDAILQDKSRYAFLVPEGEKGWTAAHMDTMKRSCT